MAVFLLPTGFLMEKYAYDRRFGLQGFATSIAFRLLLFKENYLKAFQVS